MLRLFSVLLFCLLSWNASATDNALPSEAMLPSLIKQLPISKLKQMAPLIDQIAATSAPQVRNTLQSLLAGELYYLKANKQVVHAQKNAQKKYQLTDILSGNALPAVKKSALKKIKTNNRLRGQIRNILANLDLNNSDKAIRIGALNQLLNRPNEAGIKAVSQLIKAKQDNTEVKQRRPK